MSVMPEGRDPEKVERGGDAEDADDVTEFEHAEKAEIRGTGSTPMPTTTQEGGVPNPHPDEMPGRPAEVKEKTPHKGGVSRD